MSKVHEDNAGYVGVSYEETQDPFYSYNKLALPLGESDKTVAIYEQTFVVTQANSKYVIDGVSQASLKLPDIGSFTFDLSDSSVSSHPFRIKSSAGAPTDLTVSYTDANGQGAHGSSTPSASNFWSGNVTRANAHLRQNGHAWTWTTGIPVSPTDLLQVWAEYLNNTSNHSIDFQITKDGTSTWVTADPAANDTINATGAFIGKTGFDGEWTGIRCNGGSNVSVTGILGCFVNKSWVRSSADVTLITSGTQGQSGAYAKFNAPFDYQKSFFGYEYYCNSHSGMGSTISLFVDPLRFRGALPIYKTSDRFGETLTTASAVSTGIEYYVNTGQSNFDDSAESLTYDVTSATYNTWSGSQDESSLGGYGVNSLHVLRAADGKARTWHVSTNTTDRYLWVSGDGENWSSKGSVYDTDASTQTVISRYLGWAGGSNSSITTVSASPAPEVQDDAYSDKLVMAIPMHGNDYGKVFPDHSGELNPNFGGRTPIYSAVQTRTTTSNYYGSSVKFDGSSDFLEFPLSQETSFANDEDFTIEFWMAHPGTFGTGSIHPSILTIAPLQIYRNSNGTMGVYSGTDIAVFNYDEDAAWNHFAFVRFNDVVLCYQNGRLKARGLLDGTTGSSSGTGYIGKYPGGAGMGGAYLSDFRIYKGLAKYPNEFVVPSRVDTVDRSGNSNDASNLGATWQTSVSKFYGGAVDVGGGIITVPQNQDLRVSGSNFTAECWVYADTAPTAGVAIFNHWGWSSDRRSWTLQGFTGGEVRFYTSTNGQNTTNVHIATTMPVGQWFHLAGVLEGTTMRMYVNGSLIGSTSTNNNDVIYDNTTDPITIGDFSIPTGTRFDGKVQDCKLYKGVAKYSSSFTPPERSVQGSARRYPSGIYVVS